MPGKSCVISTDRLYCYKANEEKMQARLRKIVCHELSHNLGLLHCANKDCFMRDVADNEND